MLTTLSAGAAHLLALVLLSMTPSTPAATGPAADTEGGSHVSVVDGLLDGRPSAAPSVAPTRGVWPLLPRPEVVHGFDPPAVRWGTGHRGVDLAGHVGQRVRAAVGGRVSFTGRIAGRGVVVIDHGATRTTYQPVLPTVSAGDRVGAGDVVAHLAGSGSHCAPRACLHWGLRRGEAYLDPLTLVDAPRPVRLLPW